MTKTMACGIGSNCSNIHLGIPAELYMLWLSVDACYRRCNYAVTTSIHSAVIPLSGSAGLRAYIAIETNTHGCLLLP
jgi:hypothetical protein